MKQTPDFRSQTSEVFKTSEVWLLVIFIVGAGLRLADVGAMRLSYDNSYPLHEALRGLESGSWSLLGQPSSVFLANPPLMNFIQAIPLLVWRSPWAVSFFIIGLNTLAIACVYRAARQLLGGAAGYLAAALFAINPWVVVYSRATWVQSLMPLFVTLIACSLWPVLAGRRRRTGRGMVIAGVAVALAGLTYVQAWSIVVPISLLLLVGGAARNVPRRPLIIGLSIVLAGGALYGIGLVSDWANTQAALAKFASTSQPLHVTPDGLNHAVRLVTGLDFDAQVPDLSTNAAGLGTWSKVVYAGLGLALLAGVGLAGRAVWQKRRERPAGLIVLISFCVPILLSTVTSHPIHPHYLLITLPAGQLLAAWGLLPLMQRPFGRGLVVAGLSGAALVFGLTLHEYNLAATRQPTTPKFDGWTLEAGTAVGEVVRQLTVDNRSPRRLVVDARSALIGSFSGQMVRVLDGLDYPSYVTLPGVEPLLYIMVNTAIDQRLFGPRVETFPDRALEFPDGTRVAFVRVQPYDRAAALRLPQVPVDWPSAAGLTLLGYTLNSPIKLGSTIELATYWRVDDIRPGSQEWYIGAFYQLRDQWGQLISSADGHGQWARRWQLGDVYVERTTVTLPADLAPGHDTLNIGVLDGVHAQAYPFQPPEGAQDSWSIPVTIGSR
jgi:4-amino-4-deoxy-L-arabinose transferase-like glycosyltransferase